MKAMDGREQVIQKIAAQLRETYFKVEFNVVEKPVGIHIIYDVTREQMDELIEMQKSLGVTIKKN